MSGSILKAGSAQLSSCLGNSPHPYKKDINPTLGYQLPSHRGHLILFILEHPNIQDISTFSKLPSERH